MKHVHETLQSVLRYYNVYLVGGAVRDVLMGRQPKDYDFASAAHPEDALNIFSMAGYRVIPTGLQHGTITILIDEQPVELTTFRTDGTYTDGRRPDNVVFTASLREDLSRRDFTMNAMAMKLDGTVIDPFGGQDDINAGIIRAVGNPQSRFKEDPLRVVRAARFAAVYGFDIEAETLAAMRTSSHISSDKAL